jgi:hypothetical protein
MEDLKGAEDDGKMALSCGLDYEASCVFDYSMAGTLGNTLIECMDFRLDTWKAIKQYEKCVQSLLSEVRKKVKAGDFQGALAVYDSVNMLLLRRWERAVFLEERGVLRRLAVNLDEALEDLTVSLKIGADNYDGLSTEAM